MKKNVIRFAATVLLLTCPLFVGCNKKEEPPSPGPAEQIGREIDKTMLGAVKQAQEVQKKLDEKVQQANEEMKNLGPSDE